MAEFMLAAYHMFVQGSGPDGHGLMIIHELNGQLLFIHVEPSGSLA